MVGLTLARATESATTRKTTTTLHSASMGGGPVEPMKRKAPEGAFVDPRLGIDELVIREHAPGMLRCESMPKLWISDQISVWILAITFV